MVVLEATVRDPGEGPCAKLRARAALTARCLGIGCGSLLEFSLTAFDCRAAQAGGSGDGADRAGTVGGRLGGGPEAQLAVVKVRREQFAACRNLGLVDHRLDVCAYAILALSRPQRPSDYSCASP